jgi:hypothetical protein
MGEGGGEAMTRMKEQAIEILHGIPDDKLAPVIEILKGLRVLYSQSKESPVHNETPDSVMGIWRDERARPLRF